jgi:hypothetical protein
MHETYDKLIALLDANKASYCLIDHLPEGQTDKVSALRGHPVEAAAKCIVLIVKIGRKTSRFVWPSYRAMPALTPARSSRCFPAPHMQGLRQRTSPSASLEA